MTPVDMDAWPAHGSRRYNRVADRRTGGLRAEPGDLEANTSGVSLALKATAKKERGK